MRARDAAELVRLPAALTVPGDTLCAAATTGWPLGRRTWALPVASTCLYWAGMALNDYADRDLDRDERPERPIPSGRVRPEEALALAAGLTGAGLGVAAYAGGRTALRVAVPLAAAVWTYDLAAKSTRAGPAVMAAARGLDVLLGAGGRWRPAALPCLAVTVHTAAVTGLSRGEVHGASPAAAYTALVGTAASAGVAAVPRWRRWSSSSASSAATSWSSSSSVSSRSARVARWAGAGLAGAYAAVVGRSQAAAASNPDAATVRSATGSGVRGIIMLQSALAARAGAPGLAAGLLAAGPVARLASKVVSPT
ncbi:SCO3242 family prenyltransferase [Phytoactinopolyspora halotolerans]|uniref:UbiA family prenyltransferase n=1 Tax=Phytoactinopolyspora halotolerans TaxID=1981512 RepID=A0A6L9SEJ6_9ACTN|nr:UbiA family prenyltransferase [Phytoactinopolyspora halotolerans]NEE03509.1 UbiA family prenyltransferase [Phytoactinopolyspora halotolerans]